MNRYDPRPPRALFGLAAAAITAVTLALAVVMPAGQAPQAAYDDVATRVANERCVDQGGAVTAIDVVGERHAHATPVAQAQRTALRPS